MIVEKPWFSWPSLVGCMHCYKMWVQFSNPYSLDHWIHSKFNEITLRIGDTFCCNDVRLSESMTYSLARRSPFFDFLVSLEDPTWQLVKICSTCKLSVCCALIIRKGSPYIQVLCYISRYHLPPSRCAQGSESYQLVHKVMSTLYIRTSSKVSQCQNVAFTFKFFLLYVSSMTRDDYMTI